MAQEAAAPPSKRARTATATTAPSEAKQDADYFTSYSDLRVHEDMLRDFARTDAYRKAIAAADLEGKVVLDVGGGTGVLSIFAAREGKAKRVYCVEASAIGAVAEQAVRANNVGGTVVVLRGRMEDVVLPETVDVIVSEWMGFGLLYEAMLDSVLLARDRWLKPDVGRLLPDTATMRVALLGNDVHYHGNVRFWDSVMRDAYGLDYGFVRSPQWRRDGDRDEVVLEHVPPECVLSRPATVATIDLATATVDSLKRIESTFELQAIVAAPLHGVVVWFDVDFNSNRGGGGGSKTTLSTSPYATETHWKQTCLYSHVGQPVDLAQDDRVTGTLALVRPAAFKRHLEIVVKTQCGRDNNNADGACPDCAREHTFALSSDPSIYVRGSLEVGK